MWWLGAVKQQAIIWAKVHPADPSLHHMASLGHNEVNPYFKTPDEIYIYILFMNWKDFQPQEPGVPINTLRSRQNGCHFPDDTFKCIFLNENVTISLKISLKFVPKHPINYIPALVQIMAWHLATSHYLNQWWLDYQYIYASLGHTCSILAHLIYIYHKVNTHTLLWPLLHTWINFNPCMDK